MRALTRNMKSTFAAHSMSPQIIYTLYFNHAIKIEFIMTSPKPEIFVPAGLPLNSTLWSILVAWDFRFICLVIITLSAEMSICYCLFSVGDRYVIDELYYLWWKLFLSGNFGKIWKRYFHPDTMRKSSIYFQCFTVFFRSISTVIENGMHLVLKFARRSRV